MGKTKAINFENILHHIGEGVIVFENDGIVSFVNHTAVEISGWSHEDFISQSIHTLGLLLPTIGKNAGSQQENCLVRPALFDAAINIHVEEIFQRKDGSFFPVERQVTSIIEDGKISGATLVFKDISIRNAAFSELEARTIELERSNAELEQFAFVASHDLKSPLTSVKGFLTLLEDDWGSEISPKAREHISFALMGANQLETLINDTLEISRVGYNEENMGPTSLKNVLDAALWNLKSDIEESGAKVSYPDDLPIVMAVDTEMTRLFQNLIGNGIKYRAPLVSPEITLTFELVGNEWRFLIQDNGIGVSPDERQRIFEVFRRGSHTKGLKGTGIGLAICKKIVERHGGNIWVEGRESKGSSFFFTLPESTAYEDIARPFILDKIKGRC